MLIHLTDTRPTSQALPLLFDSWAEHHLSKIASILLQLNESFKILEVHTIGLTLVIHTYLVPNCLYKCRVGIDFNDHHSNNGYCISQGAPSIFCCGRIVHGHSIEAHHAHQVPQLNLLLQVISHSGPTSWYWGYRSAI